MDYRGDRDLLPDIRGIRDCRRSEIAEGWRLRDRTGGDGGHSRHRTADGRVDESSAVVRAGTRFRDLRRSVHLLDGTDRRIDNRGPSLRHAVHQAGTGTGRARRYRDLMDAGSRIDL